MALVCLSLSSLAAEGTGETWISKGRTVDPTQKSLTEIRDSEKRRIPLDVMLQAAREYSHDDPISVTVIVTNLFDEPLLINRRMLVNHPKLQGELVFGILGPDGKRCDIEKPITPMSVHDDDFVLMPRGQSIQRTVDLSDLYPLTKKGIYKIRAFYHNDVDHPIGSRRAWKGVVGSDTIEFAVR